MDGNYDNDLIHKYDLVKNKIILFSKYNCRNGDNLLFDYENFTIMS